MIRLRIVKLMWILHAIFQFHLRYSLAMVLRLSYRNHLNYNNIIHISTNSPQRYCRSKSHLCYRRNNLQESDRKENKKQISFDLSFLLGRKRGKDEISKIPNQEIDGSSYKSLPVQSNANYTSQQLHLSNITAKEMEILSASHNITSITPSDDFVSPSSDHTNSKTTSHSKKSNPASSKSKSSSLSSTPSTTSFDPFASIRSYQTSQHPIKDSTKMISSKKEVTKTVSSFKTSQSPPISASSSSSAIINNPNNFDFLNITDPNAPLTLKELQHILSSNGYVRREEMNQIMSDSVALSSSGGGGTNSNPMKPFFTTEENKSTDMAQKKIKGVAMPQPSKVSNKHIRYGTMIASGFFIALIATTIQPNLWLIGSAIGAVYGNDIANKSEMNAMALEEGSGSTALVMTRPGGLYGDVSLKVGQKIATWYLQIWDILQTFWFLYRTGQLSYEYYKTYAKLDSRYGIQQKIDAWNSRFIEGKENFDRWEKENEVGRKLLAGMRTMWMVEESSYKKQMKGKKKSKYRIVRYVDGAIGWSKRFFRALWRSMNGSGSSELREIMKGMKLGLDELSLEIFSQRIGAAVAALIAVSFVGAMFAVAPILLGIFAVAFAIAFPNWFGDTVKTVKDALEETKARGRGERVYKPPVLAKKEKLPFVEKNSFSYYIGLDGKKKWYRTGKSRFQKLSTDKDTKLLFQWPWW